MILRNGKSLVLKFHAQHPCRGTDRETFFDSGVKRCASIRPSSFEMPTDSRARRAASGKLCNDKNDPDKPTPASKQQLMFKHLEIRTHVKSIPLRSKSSRERFSHAPGLPGRPIVGRGSGPLADVKPKTTSQSSVSQVPRIIANEKIRQASSAVVRPAGVPKRIDGRPSGHELESHRIATPSAARPQGDAHDRQLSGYLNVKPTEYSRGLTYLPTISPYFSSTLKVTSQSQKPPLLRSHSTTGTTSMPRS